MGDDVVDLDIDMPMLDRTTKLHRQVDDVCSGG